MLVLAPLKTLAASRITLTEKDNGVIDTKLHFDDGFVGGLDLNILLSESVQVTKFDFNKDLLVYKPKYEYENGSLNIKITTGGKNLLNEKKELRLGTIYVTANSDKSVSYAINISDMKAIDIMLGSYTIEKDSILINGDNKFTYEVASKDKPTEDKDDNDKNEDNKDVTDDKNENTKPGESTNEPQNSNVNDNNNTDTTTTTPNTDNKEENNTVNNSNNATSKDKNKDKNKEENKTEENTDNEKETTKENTSKKNEVHKNNIPNFLKVVLVLIIVVAAVIIGILIKKLRKNK